MSILDKHYKMRVTPEQSRAVQEACFARDIEWHGGAAKAVAYTDKPYLYVHRWEGITFGNEGEEVFLKDEEFYLIEPESFIEVLDNKPKGHPHAELMAQYAEDAAETKTPWERWEFFIAVDEYGDGGWAICNKPITWEPQKQYRRKPDNIKVGKHEFPRPLTAAPAGGTVYWCAALANGKFEAQCITWKSHKFDTDNLSAGMCHPTREAAEQHAAVLNAINRGDV